MLEGHAILNSNFTIKCIINLISLLILLRFIYYKNISHRESLTGFLMFGNGVFFVTALLHNIDMSMGFAFGLFAVFSMLRYRTETLSVRDMTYLFVTITMSLMAAVSTLSWHELIFVNIFLCGLSAFCETGKLAKTSLVKKVVCEKIDLIRPSNYQGLLSDLEQRLGHQVERVEVGEIDFMRDSAQLKVYYLSKKKNEVS